MDHQNKNTNGQTSAHIPVLLEAVLTYLAPQRGETYLDATAGYGGHAAVILERTSQDDGSVLVDQDQQAIEALRDQFDQQSVEIMHSDFVSAARQLLEQGRQFDIILADLGVSSVHLDNGERGFSINHPGPLDMRMDRSQELTAHTIVNDWSRAQLVELLQTYGEEFRAGKIADAIMAQRPIEATDQLAALVAQALGGKRGKIHPATKTFQALRIAVNDELERLRRALPLWLELLAPHGRLGVITFHSLEDRIVKVFFREQARSGYEATLRLVTKKAVQPTPEEIVSNPRARSAKLRVAAKIKTERSA